MKNDFRTLIWNYGINIPPNRGHFACLSSSSSASPYPPFPMLFFHKTSHPCIESERSVWHIHAINTRMLPLLAYPYIILFWSCFPHYGKLQFNPFQILLLLLFLFALLSGDFSFRHHHPQRWGKGTTVGMGEGMNKLWTRTTIWFKTSGDKQLNYNTVFNMKI